ncbi:MAG TPA: GNAT family protein [Coleofasciculaceae cyanobacterium]|jgi:RimJ/RimL family protein N-acetyltransferase
MSELTIHQIHTPTEFTRYESGIRRLLFLFRETLLDDFCDPEPEMLVRNTASYLPWLWLLVDSENQVLALACLTEIIPGRHAYVHGVSDPAIRKHPGISMLAETMLSCAFETLGVNKVKAEIEATSLGAKGFCLKMGFTREGCLRRDNRIRGQWRDVLIYSLFAERYFLDKARKAQSEAHALTEQFRDHQA